jgi:GR25 family glycosyltransferase involved in LPS biosynthesis
MMYKILFIVVVLVVFLVVLIALCITRANRRRARASMDQDLLVLRQNQAVVKPDRRTCPFYCINMENAHQRRRHIHYKFVSNMGIPVEFVKGVDTRGRKWREYKHFLTDNGLSKLEIAIQKNRRLRHHELTPGAVGCFLSHLECWKKFLATHPKDDDMVFILEDDSNPHPEFADVLHDVLANPPPDADVILFSFISFGNKDKVKSGGMEYELLQRPSRFYLLNAYMISARGIRKILSLLEQNDMRFEKQIDSHMTDLVNMGHIKVYNLMEDVCPQTPLGPTSIQTVPMQPKNQK